MFSCTTAQHIYCTNTVQTVVYNWTVLRVITQKLSLHVQLHNSTAHLLYKYCTNCTVYNWTVPTVITQNCNYTEAGATCSAAQQHTNCQSDISWTEVQTLVWNYIVTHNQRLDPSISRYWLQVKCRSDMEQVDITNVTYLNWRPTVIESVSNIDMCVRQFHMVLL